MTLPVAAVDGDVSVRLGVTGDNVGIISRIGECADAALSEVVL